MFKYLAKMLTRLVKQKKMVIPKEEIGSCTTTGTPSSKSDSFLKLMNTIIKGRPSPPQPFSPSASTEFLMNENRLDADHLRGATQAVKDSISAQAKAISEAMRTKLISLISKKIQEAVNKGEFNCGITIGIDSDLFKGIEPFELKWEVKFYSKCFLLEYLKENKFTVSGSGDDFLFISWREQIRFVPETKTSFF